MTLSTPTSHTLAFVGVTTAGSSIMRLFPEWARYLGLDADIVGVDLPLGAPPAAYRSCISRLSADPTISGALVTSHKTAVYDHAGDLLAELDPHARLCREISCIARREAGLAGWAKDPITAGQALDHLLGDDHWSTHRADAVCFGAGGAGIAIAVRLLTEAEGPRRLVLIDRDPARLELAREVCAQIGADGRLDARVHSDAANNDAVLGELPAGSLVINATGMGKDTPGAPITAAAVFPDDAVAWDLNYRGELEFLRLAERQPADRRVRTADGWRYFLHGWTEVIAEVFELDLTPERFEGLAAIAAEQSGRVDARPAVGETP
ncbi:MAG: hypothetical protein QOE60_1838 [Thermoleophilaceae bacterium]|jgi:shikimate 5-dehydrogenase|nr:hypothetical protein [Thermoleophilaceae bacterium]